MTVRQQQAPGTATAPVANGAIPNADRSSHFSWEDWFRHANSQQRADALSLAHQQGLLYPHQLPPITNGVKPTTAAAKDSDAPPAIVRLLAGKTDALPPPVLEAITFLDADLDDLQRQAVVRALGTPDLLLLQGLPGTGKSRVVAEIISQAIARGQRILFLAGQTASLDVILHRLVDRSDVFALRFLDTLEKPESLPAWLRGFTLDEQKRAFLERVVAGARRNHEQAETTCRLHRDTEPLWAELRMCAERHAEVDAKLQALETEVSHFAAQSADLPFVAKLADLRKSCDEAIVALDATLRIHQEALARCDQEAADLAARIAEREPGFRAKKDSRFWTLAYWTNLFNGSIIPEMEALLEQHARCLAGRQEIVQQIDQVAEQQNRRREEFDQERAVLLNGEVQARRQTLEDQRCDLDGQWTALCQRLNAELADKTRTGIDSAREACRARMKQDEQQCRFAQQWTQFVEENGPSLAARLPSFANVLAGTILRWHTDAKFRDAVASPVDLLIVEDAETLTEADLLKLSRQARRSILVAQALAEPTPAPTVAEKASRALLAAPLVSAACWQRLWQTLGGDAGRWPCTWQREQGRLVCQLAPLTAEDRQHLETEGLADAPDIELRILHRPRTRPCLAQVIFAPHCAFESAFSFMVREVQEFPLEPVGQCAWWSDEPQRFCRHLGPTSQRIAAWLTIESGLRLGTVADEEGEATRVGCIEFDKAAGWDRARAEAWLHRHRPFYDHERTIFLQTPYRFARPLAQIVESVVRCGDWLTAALPMPSAADRPFEFAAVPPLAKPEWPREGAGLELDLSAGRHADRLPVGLRQGLPARGFVNYLEAQALVRRLETWVAKESAVAGRVAVLALYEGQVELLRRLIEQSEVLRARGFMPEVALPSRLHQRECDVVFLSLTRSHAHRSVAFGEDAKELPLALTRGRSRLFVFGDPGSLCKRTNWHGPLDQLDAASAHQELVRLSRLLACVQKHGPTAPTNGAASHV
jgi:AAA domain